MQFHNMKYSQTLHATSLNTE